MTVTFSPGARVEGAAAALARMVAGMAPEQVDHFAACVALGRIWERGGARRWVLDPQVREAAGTWRAWEVGSDHIERGERAELVALAAALCAEAVRGWEDATPAPPWVERVRRVEGALRG